MHCTFFDRFMPMATGRMVWVPFYAVIILMLLYRLGWRRGLMWIATTALCITVADQLCATLIRPIVGRMRPANELNPLSEFVHIVDGYRGGRYGFPSCHGSNSFALATIIALIMKKRKITLVMMVWAVINVYTRIYLGVHYPGDILAGGIIGALSAALFYFGTSAIMTRYGISEFREPHEDGGSSPSIIISNSLHHGTTAGGSIGMTNLHFPIVQSLPIIVLPATLLILVILSL